MKSSVLASFTWHEDFKIHACAMWIRSLLFYLLLSSIPLLHVTFMFFLDSLK